MRKGKKIVQISTTEHGLYMLTKDGEIFYKSNFEMKPKFVTSEKLLPETK